MSCKRASILSLLPFFRSLFCPPPPPTFPLGSSSPSLLSLQHEQRTIKNLLGLCSTCRLLLRCSTTTHSLTRSLVLRSTQPRAPPSPLSFEPPLTPLHPSLPFLSLHPRFYPASLLVSTCVTIVSVPPIPACGRVCNRASHVFREFPTFENPVSSTKRPLYTYIVSRSFSLPGIYF